MSGVRDEGLLESALNRAYPTWGDEDLRPDPLEKAAALLEGIVGNHPFFDGNKRTGYAVARIQLLRQGLTIEASRDERYQLVIDVATKQLTFEQIVEWLRQHTAPL